MAKLSSILDQIDSGAMLLPEFQRGYVWNREQVRALMRSLYRGYPVGALLIWETEPNVEDVRGTVTGTPGVKQLLLDGQQRISTLYGIVRGAPPAFFEGDEHAFEGLYFHLEQETFEFYAVTRMKDDPLWVNVTELFRDGLQPHIQRLSADPATKAHLADYLARLTTLRSVLDREFHAENITGKDMTIDQVVDIFNKVNSGGTKLSKGDLALAKICATWPGARTELRTHLAKWSDAEYDFSLDWLLRNVNAVATGKAPFEALEDVSPVDFQQAMESSTRYISAFLDLVAGRLGLDHNRVFMGRYAVPVVSLMQHLNDGKLGDSSTQDRLLFWYVSTALWGRFTGSTESTLSRDYDTARDAGVQGLITELERWRGGNLTVSPHDFEAYGRGSRFYPLLYMLSRVGGARDLGTGIPLQQQMLGHLSSLQVHHIFPKAFLYKKGYGRGEVNSVANFCFLTQQTNLEISDRRPEDYFVEVQAAHPGVLESQWIPTDRSLWTADRYEEFLEARRELLARSANSLLNGLRNASLQVGEAHLERIAVSESREETVELAGVRALIDDLSDLGYTKPELDVEVVDPQTGEVLAVAEAFWDRGLQPGLGEPVVLELDPVESTVGRMRALGFEVFTTIESLSEYAERHSRGNAGDDDDVPSVDVGHPEGAAS